MPYNDRSGTKIWWEALSGSGSPVLIIQGLGYPSDASWRLLPALTTRHQVILMDNRGVGRSDIPSTDFSIPDMAADAAAVIEAAQLGPVHVLGLSMGGLIAQELALTCPELVRTLIIGCSSPGGREAVYADDEVREMLTEISDLSAPEAAYKAARVIYAENTDEAAIAADIRVRMKRPTTRKGYLKQLSAIGRYEGSLSRLDTLAHPVLILHGSADRLVPPENAVILHASIPHSQLKLIPSAGHVFTTDDTESTVREFLAFTEAHDSMGRAS